LFQDGVARMAAVAAAVTGGGGGGAKASLKASKGLTPP